MKSNYSLTNSIDFVDKVKKLKIKPSYKLASLDIVNLYTDIRNSTDTEEEPHKYQKTRYQEYTRIDRVIKVAPRPKLLYP